MKVSGDLLSMYHDPVKSSTCSNYCFVHTFVILYKKFVKQYNTRSHAFFSLKAFRLAIVLCVYIYPITLFLQSLKRINLPLDLIKILERTNYSPFADHH